MIAYLFDTDLFMARNRHPFPIFVSRFNSYVAQSPAALSLETAAPADCRHLPVCQSDAEHTRPARGAAPVKKTPAFTHRERIAATFPINFRG